jgi:hypothetical protein
LFLDVRQRHHIRSLPALGWPIAERTQTAQADIHSLTQASCRNRIPLFFPSRAFSMHCRAADEPKPDGFWLAKNCVLGSTGQRKRGGPSFSTSLQPC